MPVSQCPIAVCVYVVVASWLCRHS